MRINHLDVQRGRSPLLPFHFRMTTHPGVSQVCLRPQPWVLTQLELLEPLESLGDKVYGSGLGKAIQATHLHSTGERGGRLTQASPGIQTV